MALYTKSIQEPKSTADGIRICIMRKPPKNSSWDIWMPTLAPSFTLLEDYQKKLVDWPEYIQQFHEEVIVGMHKHLELLAAMSENHTITILCWETSPKQCHRTLVAQACQKINPTLPIIIK